MAKLVSNSGQADSKKADETSARCSESAGGRGGRCRRLRVSASSAKSLAVDRYVPLKVSPRSVHGSR